MKRASTAVSAATTLVPSTPGGELAAPPKFSATGGVDDYSDVEVDVTAAAGGDLAAKEKERNSPGWKPGFIKKHEEEVKRRDSLKSKAEERPGRVTESPTPMSRKASSSAASKSGKTSVRSQLLPPEIPGSVPHTPSLIRAYERINRARQESFPSPSVPQTPGPKIDAPSMPLPQTQIDGLTRSATGGSPATGLDDNFWAQMRAKAAEDQPVGYPHTPRR